MGIQLTLGQQKFEPCGSTYTRFLFNTYVLQCYTICSCLILQIKSCGYRGPTVKSYLDFQLCSTPNPHIVQRSAVFGTKETRVTSSNRRLTIISERVKVKAFSHVRLFVTPWTIQSVEFSRPEYWSG